MNLQEVRLYYEGRNIPNIEVKQYTHGEWGDHPDWQQCKIAYLNFCGFYLGSENKIHYWLFCPQTRNECFYAFWYNPKGTYPMWEYEVIEYSQLSHLIQKDIKQVISHKLNEVKPLGIYK